MRRAIASALRAFAKRVEPISGDAPGRNGEGVWTAACDLKVMNLSRSNFDVCHRDGAIEVTIHPQFESHVIVFPDGSVGLEYGPENTERPHREVEWPRGGAENTASHEGWENCQAAAWAAADRSGWTLVDEVELDGQPRGEARSHGLGVHEGRKTGEARVFTHE